MSTVIDLAVAAVSGGGLTIASQSAIGWLKARSESRTAERDTDIRLEEHRDALTFDLLTAARTEMTALRNEVADLRPISVRVAHLEEALDHIHALLHADGEAERKAAERRAKAFLRRMRPEIGDLRNSAQAATSAQRVMRDIEDNAK